MAEHQREPEGDGRRALLCRIGAVVAGSTALGSSGVARTDGVTPPGPDVPAADVATTRGTDGSGATRRETDAEVRWTTQLNVEHAEVRSAGDVFLVFRHDLIAVDAFDGTVRWQKEDFLPLGSRVGVVDGTAYAVTGLRRSQHLYAIDTGTGDTRWTFESEGGIGSIHAADGRLAIISRGGKWYVVDDETGSVEASGRLDEDASYLAGFDGEMLYAYALDGVAIEGFGLESGGTLHAVSIETGRVKWTTDEPVRGATFDGERLYVAFDEARLTALDPVTGQRQWTLDGWESEHELLVPTLLGGALYGAGWDVLERIDPETGEPIWVHRVSYSNAPLLPMGTGDEVVITARGMRVFALDHETGEEEWAHSLDGSRPDSVFEDGILYVGAAGNVRALDQHGSERWRRAVEGPDGLLDEPEVVKTHGIVCVLNGEYLTGIDVNEPPEADFEVGVRATAGDVVTFEAEASDREFPREALTYEWAFDDGTEASGRTAEHTYDSPGTYTVTLTVTDPLGETDTASETLEVQPPPTTTPTPTPVPEDLPGFGAGFAVASLAAAAGWLARRRD